MNCYKTYIDTPDGSFFIGFYDNLADARYEFPKPWFECFYKKDGIHVQRKTLEEVKKEMQE